MRLALALFVALAAPIEAKTLYVNPTHASDSDATTYANNSTSLPWTTIGRAVWGTTNPNSTSSGEAATAADLVLVLSAGSPYATTAAYASPERYIPLYRTVNEGTSDGARITIRCVDDFAAPTVVATSGCSLTASVHQGPVMGTYQRDYITWDGFAIDENDTTSLSDTGPIVAWQSVGIEFLNGTCVGIQTDFGDNHNCFRLEESDDVLISNYNISGTDDTQGGENPAAIMLYENTNVVIEYVTITDSSNGVFVKASNPGPVVIRRSVFHTQERGVWIGGIGTSGGSDGVYMYENIMYAVDTGLTFISYDAISPIQVRVCNNTIRATTSLLNTPLRFQSDQITGLDDVVISGNIFYVGYASIEGNDQAGAAFAAKAGPAPSALVLEHNVYFGASNTMSRVGNTSRNFATWKTFTGTDAASPASVDTDPLFIDATTHDYRLQSGSPARLGAPDTCDIDGDANTSETKDAGARQFADNGAPIQIGYSGDAVEPEPPASGGPVRLRFRVADLFAEPALLTHLDLRGRE